MTAAPLSLPALPARVRGSSGRALARSAVPVALLALALVALAGYFVLSVEDLNGRARRQIELTGHHFVISDLFPRWFGAQAILRGHDPYGAEVAAGMHQVYYGRQLDVQTETTVLKSVLGFFYPPYVILPLLPLLWLPFEAARWLAALGLGVALLGSYLLWARLAGGVRGTTNVLLGSLALLSFHPILDVLWLQQLSGLVLLYLVGAFAAASRGRHTVAGGFLALAMIKPQVAALPAGLLLFWSLWERRRWGGLAGFTAVMALQLAASEVLVPGWLSKFLGEAQRYQELNTSSFWLPTLVTGSTTAGALWVAAPLTSALAWVAWRSRHAAAGSPAFVSAGALSFAVGTALVPSDISVYNRVLLLVPLATVLASGSGQGRIRRGASWVLAAGLAAPAALYALGGWQLVLGYGAAAETSHLFAVVGYILQPLAFAPAALSLALRPHAIQSSPLGHEGESW